MSETLKTLYTRLVTNKLHEVNHWHTAFMGTAAKVKTLTSDLAERDIDLSTDEETLRILLFEADNGVSAKGQSILQTGMDKALLGDVAFLHDLKAFLRDPILESFNTFKDSWIRVAEANEKNKNPLLWNRVAGAATRTVSTTADEPKFDHVFNWLQERGYLPKYSGEDGWYAKNLFLMKHLKEVFKDELALTSADEPCDDYYLSQFVWYLYENTDNPFALKKQLVKYGPPGTGKTYLSYQEAELAFKIWKSRFAQQLDFQFQSNYRLVQFHPSFSYEDFIEGMRPQLVDGQAQLTLQNGVFKDFCKSAAKWEIDLHPILTKEKKLGTLPKEKTIANLTLEELIKLQSKYSKSFEGKPYWDYLWALDAAKFSKVTLEEALPPYFFVIDEINRAELSRVFGELMICLEYRGSQGLGLIQTQYAGLNDKATSMIQNGESHHFFVPHNLYLLGTMNSIDRSVESFDFALRRRFRWELVLPDPGLVAFHWEQNHKKEWSGLGECLKALNKKISDNEHLGEDYQIGHAYLMNLRYTTPLNFSEVKKRIWNDSLAPLLHEYLRGTGDEKGTLKALGEAFGVKQ